MEILSYLLKASLCMAFFYLSNLLIFKKLNFYALYRSYILSAIVCSLAIPLLQVKSNPVISVPVSNLSAVIAKQEEALDSFLRKPLASPVFDIKKYLLIIYLSIVILMLLGLAYMIFSVLYIRYLHGEKINGKIVVYNHYRKSSSFFNIIFLNNKDLSLEDQEQIIAHECLHMEFKHSIDVLFVELVRCMLWFNPFIYLLRKDLKDAHEYQVDQAMTRRFDVKEYAKLLVRLSSPNGTSVAHQFSSRSLEERISRMFNQQTTRFKKLNYLLVVPLVFILGYFLSAKNSYAFHDNNFTLVIDAGHGGMEVGARYRGRTEKYYTLLMAKRIAAIAAQQGLRVILTRTDDGDLKLASRIKRKGTLFISLHVKGADESLERTISGLDIIVSEENKQYEKSRNFARILQHNFKQLEGINTAEVAGSTRNYILRNCPSPAVLIELGCISNESDIQYISSLEGQEEIAGKILDAVKGYHD